MKQVSLDRLSKIVEQKRNALGWTQDLLGEKTNIHRLTIGRIESGKYLPSLPQLNELLRVLNIDFVEVLEEHDPGDIFLAMLGETKTAEEKAGFEKMINMMLCLRKHDRLRRALNV